MTIRDLPAPPPGRQAKVAAASRRVFVLIALLLGAAWTFCHGCHAGDHDDELVVHWLSGEQRGK
jgi:hypothetical protein